MLIQDIARRVGISTTAVRYYEREGLIDGRHVTRRPNRYRDYDEAAVDRLRLVLQARSAGMSIAEVKILARALDGGPVRSEAQLEFLRAALADLDRQAEAVDAVRQAISARIVGSPRA